VLLSLLILPLFIPVLIFGAGAVYAQRYLDTSVIFRCWRIDFGFSICPW
jgi:ABC-type transport system involved in cytochrome c biogenesis permease component